MFIYKSVSDLNVTIVQPRDMNFRDRISFTGSNFFIVRFARIKNFPFNFLVFLKENREENIGYKENGFLCVQNER